ncbi:MAG: CatB-related O-acetyltransferase [Deltaproteobacteria bacterium]
MSTRFPIPQLRRRLSTLLDRVRPTEESVEERRRRLVEEGVLEIGEHTYGCPHIVTHRGDTARVKIGDFCSLAADIEILVGGNHRVDWVSTFPFRAMFRLEGAFEDGHPATKGDVVIGNDVWVGRGAKILSGVHVGDGAAIAGYALVVKDVPPYAIVGGNPAKVIRRRFEDDQIDALLRIAWWKWPLDEILSEVPALQCDDIAGFIEKFDPMRARS